MLGDQHNVLYSTRKQPKELNERPQLDTIEVVSNMARKQNSFSVAE